MLRPRIRRGSSSAAHSAEAIAEEEAKREEARETRFRNIVREELATVLKARAESGEKPTPAPDDVPQPKDTPKP